MKIRPRHWLLFLFIIVNIIFVNVLHLLDLENVYDIRNIGISISYLVTVVLLIQYREKVHESNIDFPSLLVFGFLGPLLRILFSQTPFSLVITIVFSFCGFFLIGWYILRRPKGMNFYGNKGNHIGAWTFFGVALVIVNTIAWVFFFHFDILDNGSSLIFGFGYSFIFQLAMSSTIEEPIYRGILWGTFRDIGCSNQAIIFLQVFVFWLAHLYLFPNIISLFLLLPVYGLLFGLLAMKTKSLIPSIIVHAFYNAFGTVFQ